MNVILYLGDGVNSAFEDELQQVFDMWEKHRTGINVASTIDWPRPATFVRRAAGEFERQFEHSPIGSALDASLQDEVLSKVKNANDCQYHRVLDFTKNAELLCLTKDYRRRAWSSNGTHTTQTNVLNLIRTWPKQWFEAATALVIEASRQESSLPLPKQIKP